MGSKLDSFLRKRCFLLFCSRRTAYIVRDNVKIFTSVGLSYKDVILFSKIFYVFDVVYLNQIAFHANFSGLNYVATPYLKGKGSV